MTPQEALAQAIQDAEVAPPRIGDDVRPYAAAILDALPQGWYLGDYDDHWLDHFRREGAQQERERLRNKAERWRRDGRITTAMALKLTEGGFFDPDKDHDPDEDDR